MFGNNKPFGGTNSFQSTSFGTASPFGQNTSAFGAAKPLSTGFGNTPFGSAPPNTSIFSGSGTSGGGLFGTNTTTSFGQPSTSSTGFSVSGFAAAPSGGSLFNSTQNATGSTLFQSPSSSAFGAPKSTFGGFGGTSSTNLFGQNQQTSSLFNAGNSASTGLFGSSTGSFSTAFGGSTSGTTGTTIKFNPLNGTDTMIKNGVTSTISIRHQCITVMKEYESKSLEELRMEDYLSNRKGPQQGSISTFGATQSSLFGANTATPSTGLFQNQNKPMFGGSTTFGATANPPSVFGQPMQQQNNNLFGAAKPVSFGTPATTAGSSFNFNSGAATNIFGTTTANQNKSIFGAAANPTTSGGLFGSTMQQPASSFGSAVFGPTPFSTANQSGIFGNKTGFGATTTAAQSFSFVNPTSTTVATTTPFGNKPNTGFGTPFGTGGSTFSGFNTGTSLFNQNKPAPSFGNTSSTGFGTGLGGLGTSGGSLFTANKPGGLSLGTGFGANTNSAFGTNSSLNFMGNTNLQPNNVVLGSDQSVAQLAQQQTQAQQQLLALAQSPFGDSPLFRNLLQDSSKREEVLKPTNPTAQRALNKSGQFKISPRPSAKIKPQPLHVTVNGKASLFDGLDEDDLEDPLVAFVPRKSVKKLNLKPKLITPAQNADQYENIVITGSLFIGSADKTSPVAVNVYKQLNRDSMSGGDGEKKSSLLTTSLSDSDYRSPDFRLKTNRNSLNHDDTIADLNVKNKINSNENDDSEKENVSQDFSVDGSVDNDSEPEVIEVEKPHPAGIILSRSDYYTIPSMNDLANMVNENGDCIVENFTIGRAGYGNVYFFGKTNVAGMNLDEIVHFRKKQIIIYPDNDSKPTLGEGLNKKAQITLDSVWPMDKTTCKVIKNPERLQAMQYQEFLERLTVTKLHAKFIDYRPDTGSWVFQVAHFSKYGLDDSDEDDLPIPPKETEKLVAANKVKTQKGLVPSRTGLQTGVDQDAAQRNATAIGTDHTYLTKTTSKPMFNGLDHSGYDEDDVMVDVGHQSFATNFQTDDYEMYEPPSHQLAAAMEINSQKMQVMKASLFAEQMFEGEDELTEDKENMMRSNNLMNRSASVPTPSLLKQHDTTTMHSDSVLEQKQFFYRERIATPLKRTGVCMMDISRSSPAPSEPELDLSKCLRIPNAPYIPPRPARTLPAGRLRKAIPFAKSLLYNQQHLIADAACFMGRRFRVGWGPNWTLTQCATDIHQEKEGSKTDANLFLPFENTDKFKVKLDSTCYAVTIKKVNVGVAASEQKARLADLEQCLAIQFNNSKCAIEEGCPIVTPAPGVQSIHQLAAYAKEIVDSMSVSHPDYQFLNHFHDVWNLCVSLWGHIPGYDEIAESGNTHAQRMARRKVFTQWLRSVSAHKIQSEIESKKLEIDGHVSAILSYLSGCQTNQACQLAQAAADHRLALLLSQAGGSSEFRRMVQKQLENWEELKADKYISVERLKIYALLAGTLVWPASFGSINTCEDLDWKRALAIHLQYFCSSTASLTDALIEYKTAFKGTTPAGKYCAPPLPPYLEQKNSSLHEDKLPVYDVCYHLLMLYMKRSHRLERVLCPSAMTANPLDFRLSWLLYQSLGAIGFGHLSESAANNLHTSFAAQLESVGLWCWAVFVIAHISDPKRRFTLTTELLTRHIGLKTDPDVEDFLHKQLLIPKDWISLAKASRAAYEGNPRDEAWHLLKAGRWSQSHDLIMRHIAPDAIINESYDYLRSFLIELAPLDRSSIIRDWNIGGQVYLDYIHVSQTIDQIKNREIGTYELEDLQPNVTSLCSRVANIQCRTAKDRLCQAEMAKKTANLLRAVFSLQYGDRIPTQILVPHLINLPLPEDYAIQELRAFAESNLCEMTA